MLEEKTAENPLTDNAETENNGDRADMARHCAELFAVVRPGGSVHYIVGNSKFYDTLLPVKQIFAHLFAASGFSQIAVKTIRKRTSKKELFESTSSPPENFKLLCCINSAV